MTSVPKRAYTIRLNPTLHYDAKRRALELQISLEKFIADAIAAALPDAAKPKNGKVKHERIA